MKRPDAFALSPSMIDVIDGCMAFYYSRYVWDLKEEPDPRWPLRIGNAVHEFADGMTKRGWGQYEVGDIEEATRDLDTFHVRDAAKIMQGLAAGPPPWEDPFLPKGKVVGSEVRFGVSEDLRDVHYKSPEAFLRGKLDNIIEFENGDVGSYDYKTGWGIKSAADMLDVPAVRAYALMLAVRYPEATNVRIAFRWLRFNTTRSVVIHRDQALSWLRWAKSKHERRISVKPDPTPGEICDFCPFRYRCKAWKDIPEGAEGTVPTDLEQRAEFVGRYLRVKRWVKKTEAALRDNVRKWGPVAISKNRELGFHVGKRKRTVIGADRLGRVLERYCTVEQVLAQTGITGSQLANLIDWDTPEQKELYDRHVVEEQGDEFSVRKVREE